MSNRSYPKGVHGTKPIHNIPLGSSFFGPMGIKNRQRMLAQIAFGKEFYGYDPFGPPPYVSNPDSPANNALAIESNGRNITQARSTIGNYVRRSKARTNALNTSVYPKINAEKVIIGFHGSNFGALPNDVKRNIAEIAGKGFVPKYAHQIKGSKEARAHMDYLRSLRRK